MVILKSTSDTRSLSMESKESFILIVSGFSNFSSEGPVPSYLDLGLGSQSLRMGHWKVGYLTSAKLEQIKLCILDKIG